MEARSKPLDTLAGAVLLALATYGKGLCDEAMRLRPPVSDGGMPLEQLQGLATPGDPT